MKKVSVLMPSYNYEQYLPIAIESVLSQSYSNLELIIVDDCSTDGSRDVIEKWTKLDHRVVGVYHKENHGLAVARNSGLAVSSGEFVALCDSDDTWCEDKLKAQIAIFQEQPGLGVVHSDSEIIDMDGTRTGELFSQLFHVKNQVKSGLLFDELCKRNFLCVPTVVLRRAAIQFAGGFDNGLRSLEDWLCWTKVAGRYPFYYIDDALAQYRMHGTSLSSNSQTMALNRIKALRMLIDSKPEICSFTRGKMMYSLGMSCLEIADTESAVKAFASSIEANPVDIRSWVRCSQAAFRLVVSRCAMT